MRPPHRRRFLRRLLVVFLGVLLVLLLAVAGTSFYALQRLPTIAKWAIEQALPGVTAELGDLKLDFAGRLEVSQLALKSRQSGEVVLQLHAGEVVFDFRELVGARVTEIRLVHPKIEVSPELFTAMARGDGSADAQAGGRPWAIGRLVCDYGELRLQGVGPEGLEASAKFAFDIKGLSSGGESEHEAVLWDVLVLGTGGGKFLVLDLAKIRFSLAGLRDFRRIESLELQGGELVIGKALQGLFDGPGAAPASDKIEAPFVLGRLAIERVHVKLEDERELVAEIQFALNTALTNVPLSKAASALGEEIQFFELADLEILSPLDPLAKVLTVRGIGVEFTISGLLRKEIRSITATAPTIHVSQDLFWFMEDSKKRLAGDEEAPDQGPGWIVKRFTLVDGRLVLGSGGRASYGLPLTFRTHAENVALRNLASLQAQGALEIPGQQYVFDSYQLEFSSQSGELRFAYPPEKGEENLVGTLNLDHLRWRQYQAAEAWVSVTFDHSGINGFFGGAAYGGYISGGFSFFFSGDSPWIGWVSGEAVDLARLTEVISPQNFHMTGPLNFEAQVDAQRQKILRMKGNLLTTAPGQLKIRKLDDLLGRIPQTWGAFKQDSVRIALETLRDFAFTACEGKFWFVDEQGIFDLGLQGPHGSRNFQIVLHADDSPSGRWKATTQANP